MDASSARGAGVHVDMGIQGMGMGLTGACVGSRASVERGVACTYSRSSEWGDRVLSLCRERVCGVRVWQWLRTPQRSAVARRYFGYFVYIWVGQQARTG